MGAKLHNLLPIDIGESTYDFEKKVNSFSLFIVDIIGFNKLLEHIYLFICFFVFV